MHVQKIVLSLVEYEWVPTYLTLVLNVGYGMLGLELTVTQLPDPIEAPYQTW